MVSVDNVTIFQRNIFRMDGAVRVVIYHQQNVEVVVVVENVTRGREAAVGNLVANVEVVNRTACGCRANVLNPSLCVRLRTKMVAALRIGEKMLLSVFTKFGFSMLLRL